MYFQGHEIHILTFSDLTHPTHTHTLTHCVRAHVCREMYVWMYILTLSFPRTRSPHARAHVHVRLFHALASHTHALSRSGLALSLWSCSLALVLLALSCLALSLLSCSLALVLLSRSCLALSLLSCSLALVLLSRSCLALSLGLALSLSLRAEEPRVQIPLAPGFLPVRVIPLKNWHSSYFGTPVATCRAPDFIQC